MKIDFKQPRYMLPLIVLPFLCLFFYVYKSSFAKEKAAKVEMDGLQENLADVSDQVKNRDFSDKLEAYQNQYKDGDGYTAVGEIGLEEQHKQDIPDLYNQQEKRMLDSIEKAIRTKYGGNQSSYPPSLSTQPYATNKYASAEDQNLASALIKLKTKKGQEVYSEARPSPEADPMTIFRQQMSMIDSMGKANDPAFQEEQKRQKTLELAEKEMKGRKKLVVSKSTSSDPIFNTLRAEEQNNFISAIVDQDVTGYSGSRLRIRLLDDLKAGNFIVKKGTFLYAQISGFTAQRVNLSISSIFHSDHILPVRLDVYDNDGLPGLYVPASAFREFSKELGGSSAQGLNLQQQVETNNQLMMSMLQKMFQSTSTAVSKMIRQNKARIKYNTLVYLIDPEELKNKQNNY